MFNFIKHLLLKGRDVSISLTNRCRGIISYILNKDSPVTVKEMAIKFGVSPRTIRYDLDNIEYWLKKMGVSLVKRQRKGIWIECDGSRKKEILYELMPTDSYNKTLSPEERYRLIIIELLQQDNPVKVEEIKEILGVSETTVLKDLDYVENWFKSRNMELIRKPNYGIKIEGKEASWRQCVCDIVRDFANDDQLYLFLQQLKGPHLEKGFYRQLTQLLGLKEFDKLEEIVRAAERMLGFQFADGSYAGMIVHLAVALKRLKMKRDIIIPPKQLEELKKMEEYSISCKLTKIIEQKFNISVPEAEIGYLTFHLMGAKMRRPDTAEETQIINGEEEEIYVLASEIVGVAETMLGTELSGDEQLIKGLVLHLKPVINRLKYNIPINNPLLKDIKDKYPDFFHAARMAVKTLEGKVKREITEDEIAFIALHIGAAYERQKPSGDTRKLVRAALICSSGIGTTNIMAVRLKKEFPQIIITDILSVSDIQNEPHRLDGIDLAVTTVPIETTGPQVVLVNPLLLPEDINSIKKIIDQKRLTEIENEGIAEDDYEHIESILRVIKKYTFILDSYSLRKELGSILKKDLIKSSIKKKNELENQKGMLDLLALQFVKTGLSASTWQEAVYLAGEVLYKNGSVERQYIDTMIEIIKKHGPYVVIAPGLALLHARPSDGVKELSICLVTFKKGVFFGHHKWDPVDILIAFGSTDSKAHIKTLKQLMGLIQNNAVLDNIRKAETPEEVIQIIANALDEQKE
jgi:transcriptional antiterminator/mannitol/fructose-specific phosphotransferase system IIA component (Ntr-type)